jgi:hypothetical protein
MSGSVLRDALDRLSGRGGGHRRRPRAEARHHRVRCHTNGLSTTDNRSLAVKMVQDRAIYLYLYLDTARQEPWPLQQDLTDILISNAIRRSPQGGRVVCRPASPPVRHH